jgi:hypothetical protein
MYLLELHVNPSTHRWTNLAKYRCTELDGSALNLSSESIQ